MSVGNDEMIRWFEDNEQELRDKFIAENKMQWSEFLDEEYTDWISSQPDPDKDLPDRMEEE